jgi:hypothetical protein
LKTAGEYMKTQYIVLILVVLFVLAIKLLTPDRSSQPVLLNLDASPEKQAARSKVIDNLKKIGVISKIETAKSPASVYIGERFNSLTNDEKETYMSTISEYSYSLNKKSSMVIIKDPSTNKIIGKYSQNGLSLKKK